ncbi:MAG TPA: ABC transporter permease subunit [Candidatus Limnocylindria bacterium]|nr:ABC transporter permease subunit [Candidatus Limnocylindria bacterium]
MPWILVLMVVAIAFIFYVLVYVSANAQIQAVKSGTIPAPAGGTAAMEEALHMLRPDQIQSFGVGLVSGLGSIMLIVFAASHVGTEFGWGTLRTLLAHGTGRVAFLGSKILSLALFATVFVLFGTLAAVVASYVVSAVAGYDTSGIDLAKIASAAGRGLYTFFPYMALAAVIALWSRSAGAGIAAGLVVFFAEGLVAGILVQLNRDYATIVNYGLSRNVAAVTRQTVVSTGSTPQGAASTLPDPTQAAIVLAVYTALFIAIAFWRLRTRDVTLS